MSEAQAIVEALDCYRSATRNGSSFRRLGTDLSSIWSANLAAHLIPLIERTTPDTDPRTIFRYLSERSFFDLSAPPPWRAPAIDWFLRHLFKVTGGAPPVLPESEYASDEHCETRQDLRLSSDLLWRMSLLYRMAHTINLPTVKSVLELGSGAGHFARIWKTIRPNTTYVCVDLPECLFFAHLFLRLNFPDAKIQYVAGPALLTGHFDFVLVPDQFADALAGQSFDLFVNMNSLGEMTDPVVARWLKFISEDVKVSQFAMLNRFLNRVDPAIEPDRAKEASWSFGLDRRWQTIDWEVDPTFERCPYFNTIFTRNVFMTAQRCEMPLPVEPYDFDLEDWNSAPGWYSYRLQTGRPYPPLMSRADLNLTLDLTRDGTLYRLWDAARAGGQADGLKQWLSVNGGEATPFEELLHLRGRA